MYPLTVLYEAEENECQEALMLVHSFSREQSGLADFQAFARALGSAQTSETSAIRYEG